MILVFGYEDLVLETVAIQIFHEKIFYSSKTEKILNQCDLSFVSHVKRVKLLFHR